MKSKKTPLTKDQHKKIGTILKKMRDELLLVVLDEVQQAYGTAEANLVLRAADAIDKLRDDLSNRLAKETTAAEWESGKLDSVYHPGNSKTNQNG
jgi:hypothetical protein